MSWKTRFNHFKITSLPSIGVLSNTFSFRSSYKRHRQNINENQTSTYWHVWADLRNACPNKQKGQVPMVGHCHFTNAIAPSPLVLCLEGKKSIEVQVMEAKWIQAQKTHAVSAWQFLHGWPMWFSWAAQTMTKVLCTKFDTLWHGSWNRFERWCMCWWNIEHEKNECAIKKLHSASRVTLIVRWVQNSNTHGHQTMSLQSSFKSSRCPMRKKNNWDEFKREREVVGATIPSKSRQLTWS